MVICEGGLGVFWNGSVRNLARRICVNAGLRGDVYPGRSENCRAIRDNKCVLIGEGWRSYRQKPDREKEPG